MRPELQEFVIETESRCGAARWDWKKQLFPDLSARDWVDSAVLAGESVPGLIHAIQAGSLSDADLDPQVPEAFHLQYPNVQGSFTDFVQVHQDPEELRGVISGVKGKLFELRHVSYLNEHLPEGYAAHLADSPTQPGYDLVIEGPDHQLDYLQDKFTSSAALLREAADRWPDIDIAVPHEVAQQLTDADLVTHIVDAGISGDEMNAQIGQAVDAADIDFGFHIPWIVPIWIVGDEARQVLKGRTKLRQARIRVKHRLKRSLGANLAAQGVAVAFWNPYLQLVSIPIRLMWGRFDVAAYGLQLIDARRKRINALKQALEGGANERTKAKILARTSLLLNSRDSVRK